jgi:hypothetical protein
LQLNFGVDESYKLAVPATGNPLYAQIEVSERAASKSQAMFSFIFFEKIL